MTNNPLQMILVFIAGVALGTLFFGGLWLTVRKAVHSSKPALLIFASFVFRIGITMLGFYFMGAGDWQKLLLMLLGFIAGRFVVLHFTKAFDAKKLTQTKQASHEA